MKGIVHNHPNKVTRREIRRLGGKLYQGRDFRMYVIVGPARVGVDWRTWMDIERTGPRYWLAS